MNRIFFASLATATLALTYYAPAEASALRQRDEFSGSQTTQLSERQRDEFQSGQGNKLSERQRDEFQSGQGNQ